MWDPSLLPPSRLAADLHDEIVKLASLFSDPAKKENEPPVEVLPTMIPPHQEGDISSPTEREAHLLNVISRLQAALADQQAYIVRLQNTLTHQRRVVELAVTAQKFRAREKQLKENNEEWIPFRHIRGRQPSPLRRPSPRHAPDPLISPRCPLWMNKAAATLSIDASSPLMNPPPSAPIMSSVPHIPSLQSVTHTPLQSAGHPSLQSVGHTPLQSVGQTSFQSVGQTSFQSVGNTSLSASLSAVPSAPAPPIERKRSSSTDRVREMMQTLGFLSRTPRQVETTTSSSETELPPRPVVQGGVVNKCRQIISPSSGVKTTEDVGERLDRLRGLISKARGGD